MTQLAPINQLVPEDITQTVERVLAENVRLRAWFHVLSNCQPENSAEERYARRVRHVARRALEGDKV